MHRSGQYRPDVSQVVWNRKCPKILEECFATDNKVINSVRGA